MNEEHGGLSKISRDSRDVAAYYDNWADNYNDSLNHWQYEAPKRVAAMMREMVSREGEILDAGCGTGLCGQALSEQGFTGIDGIDISEESLRKAQKTGVYQSLRGMDMQVFPFPLDEDLYDGLTCVGVMTYIEDSSGIIKEFARIVKSGGSVVVTQRDDIYEERQWDRVLELLQREKVIRDVQVSKSMPYLPENEEFADQILVKYITFKIV